MAEQQLTGKRILVTGLTGLTGLTGQVGPRVDWRDGMRRVVQRFQPEISLVG